MRLEVYKRGLNPGEVAALHATFQKQSENRWFEKRFRLKRMAGYFIAEECAGWRGEGVAAQDLALIK